MRNKRNRAEEWMRDVEQSQRNIVFPDTAGNEARFWRNIISGKGRLTAVQIIGIGIMWVVAGYGLFLTFGWMRESVVPWLLLAIFACLFLLLRWRVGKALRNNRHHVQ